MEITEEMARLTDKILSSATTKHRAVMMPDADQNKDLYITIGHLLKKYHLGEWVAGGKFMVYPEGITFIQNDSFLKRLENYHAENERKQYLDDLQAKLIMSQLKEAKIKKWLLICSIAAGILAILQIFQFFGFFFKFCD